MAELKDKVQNTLDEGRILIIGSQVLLGFQYRSAFETGFEKLPLATRYLYLAGLGLMLTVIALLMSPSAYHRIVFNGEETEDLNAFSSTVMDMALFPFAFTLGIDLYIACGTVVGWTRALLPGLAATLAALFWWYGVEMICRPKRQSAIKEEQRMETVDKGATPLKDKVKHVLTEARMVLPGAQTLLGFQFSIILIDGFEKLPDSSRYVHLASLGLIALSIVFLMTPAAYHRIVEKGEDTEHFHGFATAMVIAAMIPLALGISGDLYVVVRKITASVLFACVAAVFSLIFFYGLWFGFTLYRRSRRAGAQ